MNFFQPGWIRRGFLLLPDSKLKSITALMLAVGASGYAFVSENGIGSIRTASIARASHEKTNTVSTEILRVTQSSAVHRRVATPAPVVAPAPVAVATEPPVSTSALETIRAPEIHSFSAKRTQEGGAEIAFSTHLLFDPGTANLSPSGRARILDVIAQVKASGFVGSEITVHGHTDDSPVLRNRRLYPTNWELSGARAFAIVRLFEQEGFDPSRLTGAGHGQYQPLLPNRDLEGLPYSDNRIENRRVVIRLSAPKSIELQPRAPASQARPSGEGGHS